MSAVPKLRFNEFSHFWTAESIQQISHFVTSGSRDWAKLYSDDGAKFLRMTNLPKIGTDLLLSDMKYVTIPQNSTDGRRTSIEKGDILISITAELGKIGYVKEDLGEAYVNQHLALVRPQKNIVSPKFVAEMLASEKCRAEINRLNDAGAKAGLNLPTIRKFKISIPSLPEQQKIASFLSSLDKKIDLLRRKKDALELYKKGLMQKIFSQEIRFKQDDGSDFPEWEEMRLEEVADMKAGKFIKASKISPTNQYGFFPCYGGNGLRGYVRTSNQEGRYVLIGRQGALCGNVAITTGKFYATEHAVVTRAKSGNEIDWLFYQLEKMDLNQYAIGVAQPGLSVTSLNSLATLVPSRPEQAKIASFLSTIDTKIASVASQLEQMESFKEGLLQQMFV
ncbi:restriction endonuclease subunit S [Roseobacter sp. HKCCA0882]|uniref:restriction endonuclease subunit S n=1 Tax=Roseobacter sp. HKCCA0882 TaxID=3120337 RepID=UPI0030ECA364